MARANSATASSAFPDRASVRPRAVAACASPTSAATGAGFGADSLSGADHDPRSNEQPHSAIASNPRTDARRLSREAPEADHGTGMAIGGGAHAANGLLVTCRYTKCIGQKNKRGHQG